VTGGTTVSLTEAECTGLGEKITPAETSVCAGGSNCVRADQNGVLHQSCITKKSQ
jgi:hypothetical protein